MKTLDEVITELQTIYDRYELEGCFYCSFQRECTDGRNCYLSDALHYLKMYRSDKAQWEADRQAYEEDRKRKLSECDAARDKYIARLKELNIGTLNNPFTWDELRTMEGKPVWVEIGDGSKGWVIIRKIADSGIVSGSDGFIGLDTAYGMETTWQAYRKERE